MKEYIGVIDFSNCVEEDSLLEFRNVNLTRNLNKCEIDVYKNEGAIPHFHIISLNSNFKTCICLFEAKYFRHGSKDESLTSNQLKVLDSWLREQCNLKIYEGKTYWESLVERWRELHNPLIIWKENINITQPDYIQTKDNI